MNKGLAICLSLLLCTGLKAQDLPNKTQQQLESLADATEVEDEQDDSFLQQLAYFRKHPLNLNNATAGDLQQLRFLTDLQIQNLLMYKSKMGSLVHIYELQAVPTWDLITIEKLLPFVKVASSPDVKESLLTMIKESDQSLLLRLSRVLERSRGYNNNLLNRYLGDRNRLFVRYRSQYKNELYWGVVAEKDPGEQFFKGAQSSGFDFYSVHVFARNLGRVKALALGDYTINLGQGLTQWQSIAFGKSLDVASIKRQSEVLLPYRSAGEFLFNRGGAITLSFKRLDFTAFASIRNISGNLSDSNTFSSLLNSGLHRNANELADRNKIRNISWGGNLSYKTGNLRLGVNAVSNQFSKPFVKRAAPYNEFAFTGTRLFNASIDYSYTYKNAHVFGELATDHNWNKAFLGGVLISADAKMDIALLHRNIGFRYQNLFGNAFTESTLPVNERGTYMGIIFRPIKGWQVNAYADFFSFPWLRYQIDAPTTGSDYLLQVNHQPNRQSEIYVLFRSKSKPDDQKGVVTDFPVNRIRQSLRLHLTSQVQKNFSIRSRAELLWYDKDGLEQEEGFLGFIEGSYKIRKLKANVRFQYFETGGYNSRIYAYESDVLYSFSVPAFFNKGFRYYLNFDYDISKRCTVWLRWAQTIMADQQKLGSGLDEINGDRRTEIKVQVVYQMR